MADLIGIWRGPFPGQTAHGTTVSVGDQSPVTEADLESGHWERADSQSAPKPAPLPEPTPVFPEPTEEPA